MMNCKRLLGTKLVLGMKVSWDRSVREGGGLGGLTLGITVGKAWEIAFFKGPNE